MKLRFNRTLYQMFPEFVEALARVEALRASHYERRTQRVNFLVQLPEDFKQRFPEQVQREAVEALHRGVTETDHRIEWITGHCKQLMSFLSDAYLIKSAALIEGFVWSINEKNAHLTALCLRQEIETLALAHYANYVTGSDYDPFSQPSFLTRLYSLAFGDRCSGDNQPIHVLTAIQRYDKDLKKSGNDPCLEHNYGILSDIVHPNASSHLIQMQDNMQFWRIDYSVKKETLGIFLKYAVDVFTKTLKETDILRETIIESGLRVRLRPGTTA